MVVTIYNEPARPAESPNISEIDRSSEPDRRQPKL